MTEVDGAPSGKVEHTGVQDTNSNAEQSSATLIPHSSLQSDNNSVAFNTELRAEEMHWSSDDGGDSDLDEESFDSGEVFPFEEMKQQYNVIVKQDTDNMLERVSLHTHVAIFYMDEADGT